MTNQRPTAAYIDLDALAFNFNSVKKFIGDKLGYLAVVKADAYGHGAVECSLRLEKEGVDWLGVALPEEGIALRKGGVNAPILCLGSFWPGQEPLLGEYDLVPVIYDLAAASSLNEYAHSRGREFDVHVKIDTGMGRLGVRHEDAAAFAESIKQLPQLNVAGLMTHFAAADDPEQDEFTSLQTTRFNAACETFHAAGHKPEWIDLANSPAAIGHPSSRGNMVRLGGALYGLLDDILHPGTKRPESRVVLSLRSRIANLKRISAGESLGYGRTFTTTRDSVIALVPLGYGDGYSRGLSNRAHAIVNGHRAAVVGSVSMDWTLLDVSDIPTVAQNDDVILIGGDASDKVTAADLAAHLDTISYEITCGLSNRVPRLFTEVS